MSVLVFVDTNVLVYARDSSEGEKQKRASSWITGLWQSRQGRLSLQVLHEYYVTVTRRLKPGLKQELARADVQNLRAWRPLALNAPVLQGAWTIEERYGLSFWDGLIVSAAQLADCRYLLTEDLQNGQRFDALQVLDPFQAEPPSILS